MQQKMQALRIELMYAIARRGKVAAITDLGQEAKSCLPAAKKMIDYLKSFPMNFQVGTSVVNLQQTVMVELIGLDVSDTTMIDHILRAPTATAGYGKGSKGGQRNARGFTDRF